MKFYEFSVIFRIIRPLEQNFATLGCSKLFNVVGEAVVL